MDEKAYRTVVSRLSDKNGLGLQPDEVRYAASRLSKAKANFETQAEWSSALDSIILNYRNDALTSAQSDVARAKNELYPNCLICSKEMIPITLLGGAPAFYCAAHRVVVPKAKES